MKHTKPLFRYKLPLVYAPYKLSKAIRSERHLPCPYCGRRPLPCRKETR